MTKWRESAEALTRIGAIILGIAYVAGFLIVNLRLRIQATRVLGLFAEQYLVAGFWFLLISSLVMVAGGATIVLVVGALVPFKKWQSAFSALGWATLVLGTAFFLLVSPLRYFGVEVSGRWFWFSVIGFVGGIFILADSSDLLKNPKNGDVSAHRVRYGTQLSIRVYLVLCLLIVNFAKDVFPTIPSQLGGGEFPTVRVIADSLTRAALVDLGLNPVRGSKAVEAHLMIATENTVVLTSAADSQPPIVIPRSGVTAIIIEPGRAIGPQPDRHQY